MRKSPVAGLPPHAQIKTAVPLAPAPASIGRPLALAGNDRSRAWPIQRAAPQPEKPVWKEVVNDNSSHGGMHAYVVPGMPASSGKKAAAFANPEHVRQPRSFSGDPIRQVLRWLATYILAKHPSGVEIQCYLHNNVIYVSSNKDAVNNTIALEAKVGKLLPTHVSSGTVPQDRIPRHTWKLARAPANEHEALVKNILAKHGISVIPEHDYGCDFHAERRIAHHLNIAKLDPNCLAGTRRACMACAAKLQLGNGSHPGLLYTSKAGLGVSDSAKKAAMTAEIKAFAEAHGLLSYISLDRHTRTHDDNHDTDSEDDS